MKMSREEFEQWYYMLSMDERISIFNEYCMKYSDSEAVYEFDDYFLMFISPVRWKCAEQPSSEK